MRDNKTKIGFSQLLASAETGLDRFSEGVNRFNEQLEQLNEQAKRRMDEDLERTNRESEERRKQIQEELDADPEVQKIYEALMSKFERGRE